MANTYTQIHVQAVFSVQNRLCVIRPQWETDLYRYITGIIQNNGHKLLAINGMSDHLHIFFGLRPNQSLSSLVQDVKANSSKWINQNNFVSGRFSWQEGFGAFSYSRSQISQVVDYIENQKEHHKTKSFTEEYIKFLEDFDIPFDERYIFRPV
ncbi:IS200/IS605 family transposase [Draconibacterium mangrovi]|uniref:IS200/IS605 family transposase n=1 Tax=Draconibacterium mangrovi TaxID=2697469 RepID=UPI0013D03C60|nr:IS200/IS605 family transposase [Draconibacterium mangrovi]